MNRQPGIAENKSYVGILIGFVIVIAVIAVLRLDTTGRRGSGLGGDFDYNLDALAKIDPNLIMYTESAEPIDTGFVNAHAIALSPDGTIYTVGDNEIRVFADTGSLLNEIELTETPECLAIEDAEGDGDSDNFTIYVGMKERVELYNNQGKQIAAWQDLGDDAVIRSIAVSEDDLFVADAGNRVVLRYDKSGNIINRIGQKDVDKNIDGFVIPSPYFDLALGRDGLLYVTNPGVHHIEAYTFDGDLEFSWGEFSNGIKGFCGCCNPVSFAILPGAAPVGADDRFITCEKGITRVKIHDSKGNFIGVVAGPVQLIEGGTVEICNTPEQCQFGGFDVAVDSNGRILVLDTIKNIVRIFSLI